MKQLKRKLVLDRTSIRPLVTLDNAQLEQVQGGSQASEPWGKTDRCNGGSLATAWNCIG
jgi:hypothetical protein